MNANRLLRALAAPLAWSCAALAGACDSPTDPTPSAWEADLAPATPAGVAGSVAAATQAGRTEASILIENAEPATRYDWRINRGTCEQEGTIAGGQAVYPELTTDENGSATEETSFAELLQDNGEYAARVLLSTGTVVACGELARVR
jgi:hypothetical protein